MSNYQGSPRVNLAGDEGSSSSMYLSPRVRNPSFPKLRKLKLKPYLKRSNSHPVNVLHPKLVYSVDDDINDTVDDDSKQYLEGYKDALRELVNQNIDEELEEGEVNDDIRGNEDDDVDREISGGVVDFNHDEAQIEGDDAMGDINDVSSLKSDMTTDTVELLNLQQRQDAINSTHPFGIKIWKPSIYKKKRSVATRAEEDIHAYDPRKPNARISWGVTLTNCVWTATFGVVLFFVCILGAAIVFVLSGFAINRKSRPYVKLLVGLGQYWLFPFGKFVLLTKDKNYLEEDQLDGRSISEFHRWRLQEEGRLFFAPPRRLTTGTESRLLLKDHKGRSLRESYGIRDTPNNDASLSSNGDTSEAAIEDDVVEPENFDIKVRFFGRGSWSSGRLVFYVFFYGILQPIMYLVGIVCWLIVFTIPMANITNILCDHLRRHPLALDFEFEKEYYKKADGNIEAAAKKREHQRIILSTYRACGLHYYKYTIDGTNIFFINLLSVVIFVILDFYILKERLEWKTWYSDSTFIFGGCLFSIIPLAYFIGQAVASISAQSSMGVGAVINAFFSTIVEIFLYCVALNQAKGKLVEGSMIGSILGGVLLLPGLSMCGGALRRKTQRYNPRSAGVSSTMLLFAMLTMFAPSLFYQIYGAYEIKCRQCSGSRIDNDCNTCRFIQPTFSLDKLYYEIIKPFSLIVALALFAAYVCGLFFTLRTHASLIWATNSHEVKKDFTFRSPSVVSMDTPQPLQKSAHGSTTRFSKLPPSAAFPSDSAKQSLHQQALMHLQQQQQQKPSLSGEGGKGKPVPSELASEVQLQNKEEDEVGGHDAPNWSKYKSTVILLGATLLYAIIAEILVNTVDEVLVHYPIDPKFLGLTVFALVPNTTEFLNAISFAIGGNVALSMEIGSAYALQVVLIQIPSLVLYSIYKEFDIVEKIFPLVFPRWDIIATLISIYLFTYIYAEGKSNYFKGVILILIYAVVLIGFWFNDKIELLDDGYTGGPSSLYFSSWNSQ